MLVGVMDKRVADRSAIIAAYNELIASLTDNLALEAESRQLQGEIDIVLELMRKMVQENAGKALAQSEYQRQYGSLTERFNNAKTSLIVECGY